MLADASIVVSGVQQGLSIPSGSESGLKIGHGFDLRDGAATTLTLDFDAGRSIRYAPGNGFMMSPVIELIDVTTRDATAQDAPAPARGRRRAGGAPRADAQEAPSAQSAETPEMPSRPEAGRPPESTPEGARRSERRADQPRTDDPPPAEEAPPADDSAEK
jgi:hypothetical protein